MDFFERVRKTYLERAADEPQRVRVVDARQDLATVQAEIDRVVAEFLDRS
jgi:dTMP kinase